MTISQQSKEYVQHPYFREAVYFFNLGDTSMMEHALFELMFHVYDKVKLSCLRSYKSNKRANIAFIIEQMDALDVPDTFDARLDIPTERHAPQAKVFMAKKNPKNVIIKNQLNLFIQVA